MLKYSNVKMNKGFTLVEMLVAVTVFFLVISISTGLFVSAIRIHRYNLLYQSLLNQASYIMEYMSRSLRMAEKSNGTICTSFSGKSYDYTPNEIRFVNSNNNECWEFSLSPLGNLQVVKNYGDPIYLTSGNLKINQFNIDVSGDVPGHQPKVTFVLDVEMKKGDLPWAPRVKLQTTVSQRNLNK